MSLNAHFNSEELDILHQAYDEACIELGLFGSEHDRRDRERLAAFIMDRAKTGEREPQALLSYAITCMKVLEAQSAEQHSQRPAEAVPDAPRKPSLSPPPIPSR